MAEDDDATIRMPPGGVPPAGGTPPRPEAPRDTAPATAMPARVAPPVVSWGAEAPPPAPPAGRGWLALRLALLGLAVLAATIGGWWVWLESGPASRIATSRLPSPALDAASPPMPATAGQPSPGAPAPPATPDPLAPPAPSAPPAATAALPMPGATGLPGGPARPAAPVAPPPGSRLAALPVLLDEAGILAHRAAEPTLLRLAENPSVFVIDFPSLAAQGAALNRVAALVEKAGLPRDRVLAPDEMAAAIARTGDSPATYYYGHNYRGADLARFFRLAGQGGQSLTAAEAWVGAQYSLARGLVPPDQEIAVISVAAPEPGPGGGMDAAGRASILRHEIGHGLFATRPAYAEHIRRAWRERLTEAERATFRAFLGREGYDTTNEEVMIDEAQAYLLHTPDPRFFAPAHLGLDAAQVEGMRARLRDGAPYLTR